MNNEEILKWALDKSSTITEAKEAAEWMKRFLNEENPPQSQPKLPPPTPELLKATEKVKEILGKPIDDPDFYVDPNQLPLAWDEPPKRTRKNSTAKKNGHKILPEETEYVARKLPTIKTEEEFNAMANELDRSPGAINEWINRAYVEIDHILLPPAIFPKLYRRALKAAKEKAKAEANG
jgi:hypothetical protein